jgi:hypothetical protein
VGASSISIGVGAVDERERNGKVRARGMGCGFLSLLVPVHGALGARAGLVEHGSAISGAGRCRGGHKGAGRD